MQNIIDTEFFILGSASMQTSILARLIEKRCNIRCTIVGFEKRCCDAISSSSIALFDMELAALPELERHLNACQQVFSGMAIINADPQIQVDWLVRWPKLKGVFYCDTTEDHFIKGIEALRNNEYWLPRRLLSEYLERTRTNYPSSSTLADGLTDKERQILRAVASGGSNSVIAHQLSISPHTVKTHIYNLYRKISVSNRAQAASWAMTHLPPEMM
jgi:DNA-binding CsgD family transcriptional regulator